MATAIPQQKQEKKEFNLPEIEARVNDVLKNHPEDVERNQPLRFGAGIFLEQKWLIDQLKKAQSKKLEAAGT